MASLGGAEADEIAALQLGEACDQVRLGVEPGVVFVAHLVAGAVGSDAERVAPGRSPADVDGPLWDAVRVLVEDARRNVSTTLIQAGLEFRLG